MPETHKQLVERAVDLLRRGWKWHRPCPVVITEMASESPEHPDAIGFLNGHSILIECKASLADFRADAKKHFRRFDDHCMGTFRYFLAPYRVIPEEELPAGWGLLEESGRPTKLTRKSDHHETSDRQYEISLLCSALRRQVGSANDSVKCSVYQNKGIGPHRARIYVNHDPDYEI